MTNYCKKRVEGGQWVCNRCSTCWDRDDTAPECKTDIELIDNELNKAFHKIGREIENDLLNSSKHFAMCIAKHSTYGAHQMRKIKELLK